MESELLAIGQVARLSGLTVSALRFYDTAGVLSPAVVDERNGYRWYGADQLEDARLVARLRRVGMPLPEIARALASRRRPAEAAAILDVHLRRLEDGLSDARRELSAARALLEPKEITMTSTPWMTLTGRDLATELSAVRFAAGTDPELPALCGVLLDLDADTGVLRVVATDRYRMAVSSVAARSTSGTSARAVAPVTFVDEVIALARDQREPVRLRIGEDQISLDIDAAADPDTDVDAGQCVSRTVDGVFPDYRRLIPAADPGRDRVLIDVTGLRGQIEADAGRTWTREQDGEPYGLTVLVLDADGTLRVAADPGLDLSTAGPDPVGRLIGVNREFLLQALDARALDQLLLELDGPIAPLAFRDPRHPDSLSLLMPTRLG